MQLVRLTEKDDIETYLTRVMEAYEIDKSRWAFKLAPYLSGKAQQAYASLSTEEAAQYDSVKEAVFYRYDIKEETYPAIGRDLGLCGRDQGKHTTSRRASYTTWPRSG